VPMTPCQARARLHAGRRRGRAQARLRWLAARQVVVDTSVTASALLCECAGAPRSRGRRSNRVQGVGTEARVVFGEFGGGRQGRSATDGSAAMVQWESLAGHLV
jgi:hypothetical protein